MTSMKKQLLFLVLYLVCTFNLLLLPLPISADKSLVTDFPSDQVSSWSQRKVSKFKTRDIVRLSAQDPTDPASYRISASIFQVQFNWTFSVSPGPNFIRLHFYPISYSGLNISKALFSVSVAGYTLLRTSSSCYPQNVSDTKYMVKEFCMNIDSHIVNITFTPSQDVEDAYAFVNKIEVVPVPPNLYTHRNVPIPLVGHSSKFYIRNSIALETMYRVNIGGKDISYEHGTGMSPSWLSDDDFLLDNNTDTEIVHSNIAIKHSSQVPVYVAPEEVYTTARKIVHSLDSLSMTWKFPVEFGFCYLIRLHFCEIENYVTRGFYVYINNQTLQQDVIQWSDGQGIPVYRDYVVNMSGQSQDAAYMLVTIQSEKEPASAQAMLNGTASAQAMLNGLEILKLSDDSDNLAGSSPFQSRKVFHRLFMEHGNMLGISLAVIIVGLCMLPVMYLCIERAFRLFRQFLWSRKTSKEWQSLELCRQFSLNELKSVTGKFSDAFLIGAGGFGKVYKGQINDGAVAIKRASLCSHQGLKEFKTEIETLSRLRHCHLVSLVGFCMENKEMILVYDYMARGTLRDHLYKTQKPPLPWKHRLKICIGAARGLHYLHTGTNQIIIHRDVKSTNILLDKNWVAKVSDFGLSKVGSCPMSKSKTHVTTMVKGSFGYVDPEYYRRQKLTEKSDVYSFGVVLFEVVCARPAVIPMGEIEEDELERVNLAEWALHCSQMGILEQIIDPYLKGKIAPDCFRTFTDVAKKCLADKGTERPTMGDVLWNLELAMQQQQHFDLEKNRVISEAKQGTSNCLSVMVDGQKCIQVDNSDPTPGVEFSEIVIPRGR